jgi:imidazoleglycerol phosphate dehydratase HisB
MIRAKGGFRVDSPNYVGAEPIRDARDVFRDEGFDLALDGTLARLVLDDLSGRQLSKALRNYVRRAKRGAEDAALLAGTSKDLVEATAKHVLVERFGQAGGVQNFPTLVGQAFVAVGLAHEYRPGDKAHRRVEAALYELACAVNNLRNKEGTGHGRPWLPEVTKRQARTAIEGMGIVAETLLDALEE